MFTNRSLEPKLYGDLRHMTLKPRPFQVVKKNRDQLSRLTGRTTIPLDKRATPIQLFKASLYNESSNAFASPAYVAGAATDGQVSGNPQVRLEEQAPPYRARPGRGYWDQVLADHQQNTANEQETKRQNEKLISHANQQGKLHDVGLPHDQSVCPKCRGPTYSYTVPQASISPEAQKNHARMLNLMREARLNPS